MSTLRMRIASTGLAVLAIAAMMATPPALAQKSCADCGVVQTIRYVEEKGEGTGLGAIAGGVVGGVIGHQIGSGRGNTVATIAGAGGGAYAGHQIEKSAKKKTYWTVDIRMDGGTTRSFTYSAKPSVKEGERVKLVDGGKRLALVAN
jgi:outer membrane lipoprotein SlyB